MVGSVQCLGNRFFGIVSVKQQAITDTVEEFHLPLHKQANGFLLSCQSPPQEPFGLFFLSLELA
jgi:hypothetical protein